MPIYEYQCGKCGHEMEVMQKIMDDPLTRCPECDQIALRKLVSASSFRLKGGGWYETDFKKDNKKHLADSGQAEKESSKAGDDSSSSKSENDQSDKPAKKTKAKTDAGSSD